MNRTNSMVLACLGVMAGGTALALAQVRETPATKPSVEAISLSIVRQADRSVLDAAVEHYSYQPGVQIGFTVAVPGAEILEVMGVKIARFSDDKGTDLGDGTRPSSGSSSDKPYNVVSGGALAAIKLYSARPPAAGATSLKIKGIVSVRVAAGRKELKAQTVPMLLGHVIQMPDGKLTLSEINEVHNRLEEGVVYTFSATDGMEKIVSLRLTAGDGTPIQAIVTVNRKAGMNNDATSVNVRLVKTVDSAVLTPALYEEIKPVDVPVDLTVNVGP